MRRSSPCGCSALSKIFPPIFRFCSVSDTAHLDLPGRLLGAELGSRCELVGSSSCQAITEVLSVQTESDRRDRSLFDMEKLLFAIGRFPFYAEHGFICSAFSAEREGEDPHDVHERLHGYSRAAREAR